MFINRKRSRSRSSSRSHSTESPSKKRQKKEQTNNTNISANTDKLLKLTMVDNSHKSHCQFCGRDISRTIRIICDVCDNIEYCIDCLVLNRGNKTTESSNVKNGTSSTTSTTSSACHSHDYHIADKLNFNIFTEEWIASEELMLLSSIEKFGLDNWTDISENIGTKARLECEAHYYNFYYKAKDDFLPSNKDCIISSSSTGGANMNVNMSPNNNSNQSFSNTSINLRKLEENRELEQREIKKLSQSVGKIPEFTTNKDNKNNRSRSLAKNRNRKDQTAITSASEILGYWPKREEFDIEFLNDAELEIAELEFMDDDTEEERELKMNVLRVYNSKLDGREKRKKFVIERNLLDIKRQMNFERKMSKDDRDINLASFCEVDRSGLDIKFSLLSPLFLRYLDSVSG